jgi:Arc/MetJ-type ribon-helix-helix transcriptional regulator
MTKKTTILFPPKLYKHLERVASRQHRSVGDLVREAVAVQYGTDGAAARVQAIDTLARVNAPVGEPEELEAEIQKGALER